MTLPGALAPAMLGAALGASFNPITAAVGSGLAAALVGSPRTSGRGLQAAGVLLLAWLLGDGLRVLSRVREASGVVGTATWETLVSWALLGFAFYLLPTLVGAFVGRRVTHGTGWLSAGVIALTLSGALAAAAPAGVAALHGLG